MIRLPHQDRLKAELRTRTLLATALLVLSFLPACSGGRTVNPQELKGETNALLWSPAAKAEKAPALIILCSPGAEPHFWDPLATAASRDGYWVIVCDPSSADLDRRYTAALLTLKATPADTTRLCLVVDGKPAAKALIQLPSVSPEALIAFSTARVDLDIPPEDVMRAYHGPPLLLIACENDLDGANTAHALKDAATGYCELQMYSCGVRGADILAAAPNVSAQVLAWLKPIVGVGFGGPEKSQ